VEDAAVTAVETAAETLRDARIAEVVKDGPEVEDGKPVAFRTARVLSFN